MPGPLAVDHLVLELPEPQGCQFVGGKRLDPVPLHEVDKVLDPAPVCLDAGVPDRAVLVYANLIRSHFKDTCPIVLGGIEASLRRIAHYDFWTNKIRRSILFDAKADYLLYGMAERSIVELATTLKKGDDPRDIKGLCYVSAILPEDALELPSYKDTAKDKEAFYQEYGFKIRPSENLGEGMTQFWREE